MRRRSTHCESVREGERERRRSSKAAAPHRASACGAVQTDSRHIIAAREQETLSREAARTRRSAQHAVSKGARAPTGRRAHNGARCTIYSRSVGRLSRASLRHSGRVAYSIAHTICAAGESAARPNGTRGSGPVRRSQAAATTNLTNEPFQSDRRVRFARSRSEQSVVGVLVGIDSTSAGDAELVAASIHRGVQSRLEHSTEIASHFHAKCSFKSRFFWRLCFFCRISVHRHQNCVQL